MSKPKVNTKAEITEPSTFIVLGGYADGETLMEEITEDNTYWTLHKRARAGDLILFYITAPVSSIVAAGTMRGELSYQANPNEAWHKHYFGEVADLRLTKRISMRELREVFPEWKILRFFRQNALVPKDIAALLSELLEINGKQV